MTCSSSKDRSNRLLFEQSPLASAEAYASHYLRSVEPVLVDGRDSDALAFCQIDQSLHTEAAGEAVHKVVNRRH